MNWMMKAITLFLSRSSKLEFVIKKLMSYPYVMETANQ